MDRVKSLSPVAYEFDINDYITQKIQEITRFDEEKNNEIVRTFIDHIITEIDFIAEEYRY